MPKKNRKWGRWVASGPAFVESGQGRLYFVTDSSGELVGDYVLKELKNPKRIDRFNAELQAIATLKEHPNVVPLVDSGIYRDPEKPCYVMPKADGTLEDHIKRLPSSAEDRLCLFDLICEGVAYIHRTDIIHRDLKPENILMFSGVPKVADLGLCLIAGMVRVTPSSEPVGSRFYMAPEMEDGQNIDVSKTADVYSLGKILFYLLFDGKIFSREKHREKKWYLPRLLEDPRIELFYPILDRSIVADPQRRYEDASTLQNAFREAFNKYRSHPLTTLLKKFGTIDKAIHASESSLQSLTSQEWSVLLNESRRQNLTISQEMLKAACSSLDAKFAQPFAEILLKNHANLEPQFVTFASSRILSLPGEKFPIWLKPDTFSRLALAALAQEDDAIINTIATISMLILQHSTDVLSKLAEYIHRLRPEGRLNFLVASIKSNYPQKEQLLLSLSHDEKLDNLSVEAVVAGLCECGSPSAIARVIELADKKEMDEKLQAIGRGIVYGSSPETSKKLSEYKWNSPVMRVLIDTINRAEDHESENSNRTESEEE